MNSPTTQKSSLSNLREQLRGRWQRLAPREQRALLGLAAFGLASCCYLLLWQPQQQALKDSEQRFTEVSHLHQQLLQLPAASASSHQPATSAEALPGLLARSSSEAGLNLERMDHEAPGRVDLALEGPLGSLISWVDELEQKQVEVLSFSIEVNKEAMATARMQVQTR